MGIQNEQWARIEIFSCNLMTKHLTSLFNSKFLKCGMEKTKIYQQLINKLHAFQIVGSQHCSGSN
jgi:hypothetical protein